MARRLRIVAVVIGTAVFLVASAGCMTTPAAPGSPGIRAKTKMWPFKRNPAGPDMRAWVEKYGQNALQMPNLPDVGAATPQQRAAATDLLVRTEAATAGWVDLAAAEKAGYRQNPAVTRLTEVYASMVPGKMTMMHVAKDHPGGAVLDPNAPDMLMYDYESDGAWKLVGVMFLADGAYPGPPPTPGGPITRWHYHPRMAMRHLGMHIFFGMGNDLAHAYAVNMDGM
ncbi:hypothetical protein GCM10009641_10350 [Mycobacterium cookii]|uniref:Lipoprotein n=1 Tax=Mycobacterium cookii TaxID=1775 RepID=A0A7I7L0M7_9MYCO|nr:hypothetical protein [Mycobacterium cookii]MCV7329779.1 hypothetical protein [Mycobacterium cookii]BBX47920.1 hypothetical protein MCOO_39350 [Mycobacterium cookii]